MQLRTRQFARLAGVCACVLWSTAAYAEPGDGIRTGNFKLDLGLSIATGVNTNLFYEDVGAAPAFRADITPSIGLSTEDVDNFELKLRWNLNWTQYLGDTSIAAQSGLSTDLAAAATFNPEGDWSFQLRDTFALTNEPPNIASTFVYRRTNNDLGATLGIHPGGRVSQAYLSYDWLLRDYNLIQSLNKDEHHIKGRFVYKFLPKTTALINADYRIVAYDQPDRAVNATASIPNNNSDPIRLTGGINGLVARRVAVVLLAGYGWGRYASGPDVEGIEGLLATAEVSYLFGPKGTSTARVGFERGFEDAQVGNFFIYNRPYVSLAHKLLDDKLAVEVGVNTEFRHYKLDNNNNATIPVVGGEVTLPETLDDLLLNIQLNGSYSVTKWFDVGAQYLFSSNFTDSNVNILRGGDEISGRSFQQNIILLKGMLRY